MNEYVDLLRGAADEMRKGTARRSNLPRTCDWAADEIERLTAENEQFEWLLRHSGFIPCDIPACNCGSWHQVGGFYARFEEIKEVVEPRNGQTLLDAVKELKILDQEQSDE